MIKGIDKNILDKIIFCDFISNSERKKKGRKERKKEGGRRKEGKKEKHYAQE